LVLVTVERMATMPSLWPTLCSVLVTDTLGGARLGAILAS